MQTKTEVKKGKLKIFRCITGHSGQAMENNTIPCLICMHEEKS